MSIGAATDGEQPGHPVRVLDGGLEHGVHADGPSHQNAGVDSCVVEHRDRVVDELLDTDGLGVLRTFGTAGAAVVPGDHPHATVGVEQGRPGERVGAETVAQQHGRAVDVVRPCPEPGAVRADDVVVPQSQPVVRRR
jgi:hypothetical protein